MPYFVNGENFNINQKIMDSINVVDRNRIDYGKPINGTDDIPDGVFRFNHVGKDSLNVTVQAFDNRQIMYHRSNGFTLSSYKLDMSKFNKQQPVIDPTEQIEKMRGATFPVNSFF